MAVAAAPLHLAGHHWITIMPSRRWPPPHLFVRTTAATVNSPENVSTFAPPSSSQIYTVVPSPPDLRLTMAAPPVTVALHPCTSPHQIEEEEPLHLRPCTRVLQPPQQRTSLEPPSFTQQQTENLFQQLHHRS